uniref:Uncharacterized protein n=1 Tax=Arundo donax TaxID=35708 RepID=A0A0A9FLQ9_ARUDO
MCRNSSDPLPWCACLNLVCGFSCSSRGC